MTKTYGRATTDKKVFSRTTSITQTIQAEPEVVWKILTNSSDFARWNSTVISLEGNIKKGETIKLKSTLDPKRTFKLKVKEMNKPLKMVWEDGMGNRTYLLTQQDDTTVFSMTEKIGGPLFPLFARMIPSFDEAFEQFVHDLKKEAELIRKTKIMNYRERIGTKENPLTLQTPPLSSNFTMHVDEKDGKDILVCTVKSTILHYDIRCIKDLHQMLKDNGDWVLLGSKDEKVEAKPDTVEFWGRSSDNPVGGWYGLKKGFKGRFGMYIPPLMEYLGLAEVEHNKRNNRMRAI